MFDYGKIIIINNIDLEQNKSLHFFIFLWKTVREE